MFASINQSITQWTLFCCYFFIIFIVCGYFSKNNFSDFFLDSDRVENFIGSDPCPNCLQGYKQRTLPNQSAINVSIYDHALFKLILLFIVTSIEGICNCTMFWCTLLYVHSSIAIILIGRES